MVTQKEIAEKLNVSQSLVARALKGENQVAEATRLRIEEMARQMGYEAGTNQGARAMAMRRHGQTMTTGFIAMVFPPLGATGPQYLPFYMPLLEAADAEARRLGMEVCLCQMHLDGLPRLVRERNVDGVFFIGDWDERVQQIRALGLPVVTFHSSCKHAHSVTPDDREGAKQATRHLIKLGHRRIAFIGMEHHKGSSGQLRLQGYLEAMHEAGIEVPETWYEATLPGPRTTTNQPCYGCGQCAACIGWKRIQAKNPLNGAGKLPFSGLVCHNDAIAMATITQLSEMGYEVPRDLSITGFDGVSGQFQIGSNLTSVDFPRHEMGKRAMQLLHESIGKDDSDQQKYEHSMFSTYLLVGDSTQQFQSVSKNRREVHELVTLG